MKDIKTGFKKFYDGNAGSMIEAFKALKERPYLFTLNNEFHSEEAWTAFKEAQLDAFKAGVLFAGGIEEEKAKVKTSKEDLKEDLKAEAVEEAAEADPSERKEKKAFVKSDYITASIAAEETLSDVDLLRSWCKDNGVKPYGRGYILNEEDFKKWCVYINFPFSKFPRTKALKSE